MIKDFAHIKFNNQQLPGAEFDIITLENLFQMTGLEHELNELQVVDFFMLVIIREGKGKHRIDFTDYPYQAGSVLSIRKQQLHKFYLNPEAKGDLLLFTDNFLVSYLEASANEIAMQLFNELLGPPVFQLEEQQAEASLSIIAQIKREYFEQRDQFSLGIIRSQLHILLTTLYRIKSKQGLTISNIKYLKEFLEFQALVEKHICSSSKVSYYAARLNISSKTLNTITQSIIHQSAKVFIDATYIKVIKRHLLNTNLPIKEIAFETGFEETSNFYKYFKKNTGLTPEEFRSTTR